MGLRVKKRHVLWLYVIIVDFRKYYMLYYFSNKIKTTEEEMNKSLFLLAMYTY